MKIKEFVFYSLAILILSCIHNNTKSEPFVGTWLAVQSGPALLAKMTVSISPNGNYSASGSAILPGTTNEQTIFTESGTWSEDNGKIHFMANECTEFNGNELAVLPCSDPITIIEIKIESNVWTWVEPDGYTIKLERQ